MNEIENYFDEIISLEFNCYKGLLFYSMQNEPLRQSFNFNAMYEPHETIFGGMNEGKTMRSQYLFSAEEIINMDVLLHTPNSAYLVIGKVYEAIERVVKSVELAAPQLQGMKLNRQLTETINNELYRVMNPFKM